MKRRTWFKMLFGATAATAIGVKEVSAVEAPIQIPMVRIPDVVMYRGTKFKVHFSKIASPEFLEGVDKLQTGSANLRSTLHEAS